MVVLRTNRRSSGTCRGQFNKPFSTVQPYVLSKSRYNLRQRLDRRKTRN